MRFEILDEISDIETFATGREFAKSPGGEGLMGPVVGASARGSPVCAWRMARSIRLKYTGTRPAELEEKSTKSSNFFESEAMAKTKAKQLVVCIDNEGYPASLERRKIYLALRDPVADKQGLLRIVDESGEDYLYPKASFRPIALPQGVKKAVLAA